MQSTDAERRHQPHRIAKAKAAAEVMDARRPKSGVLGAIPSAYHLAIAQRNASDSPLLRLPPEIRNQVWHYLVNLEVILVKQRKVWWHFKFEELLEAGYLCACPQVYAEAVLMLYATNNFKFRSHHVLQAWVKTQSPGQLAAITRVEV
ncbi:hypothetical protein T440DRAFT_403239 [Plenodomus tracheiphilus IPT5]|uniref:Uncharacterized protein n=1 Tax=Plenodomus tracheiphilus IPT5 TaxID=1408161 RepID=A0A6A7AX29_9PLEO|nr:hypothetical protein T440DRAFT_403239 [Plenodomus tracheiphilus IPT5]